MVKSHRLGSHMLAIGTKGLGRHLRRSHGDGIHLRSRRGMGSSQGRTATGLVRRVGERSERTSLTGAMELRAHVGTGTRLVGRTEVMTWRVGHLTLVAGLRIAATAATLVRIATTTRTGGSTSHMVAHIAVSRLGGFAAKVS